MPRKRSQPGECGPPSGALQLERFPGFKSHFWYLLYMIENWREPSLGKSGSICSSPRGTELSLSLIWKTRKVLLCYYHLCWCIWYWAASWAEQTDGIGERWCLEMIFHFCRLFSLAKKYGVAKERYLTLQWQYKILGDPQTPAWPIRVITHIQISLKVSLDLSLETFESIRQGVIM